MMNLGAELCIQVPGSVLVVAFSCVSSFEFSVFEPDSRSGNPAGLLISTIAPT